MNREELANKIEMGHQEFLKLLNGLNEETCSQPGVMGDWSIKDIVGHLLVHEDRMLTWMIETLAGVAPQAYQPYDMPEAALNELNDQIFQQNRPRDWEELLFTWRETHAQTLAFVKQAVEEDMFTTQRYRLLRGEPLWMAVAANTYKHCEEHGRDIRAWLVKNKKR